MFCLVQIEIGSRQKGFILGDAECKTTEVDKDIGNRVSHQPKRIKSVEYRLPSDNSSQTMLNFYEVFSLIIKGKNRLSCSKVVLILQ